VVILKSELLITDQDSSTYLSGLKTIKTLKKFNHKGTSNLRFVAHEGRKEESAFTVFFVRPGG
jgi:hypothetical protein